jgi:C4-dicarboxylate-specific signal transduction histidine kinase
MKAHLDLVLGDPYVGGHIDQVAKDVPGLGIGVAAHAARQEAIEAAGDHKQSHIEAMKRKQMEDDARTHQQQLMQAGKMVALGTLVSSVAHEINNPNNFIMLNAPLLFDAWESGKPILEEYYEKNGDFLIGGMPYTEMRENIPALFSGILDGSKRIKQIVEDLRYFARRDTSDMTQSVDVNAVLKSAITLLSNMIMKSTARFSINYGENLPR